MLFLVEEFSFSDVVDDNELAVFAVKDHRMRRHLDVDRLFIFRPVTPGARKDEFIRTRRVFDYEGRNVFLRPQIVDGHGQEFIPRVAVDARGGFVDGQKRERLFVVNPDRLRCRFKQQAVTLFGIAQCFFKAFALGDVAGKAAESDCFVEFFNRRDNEIQPPIVASCRPRQELVPDLAHFVCPV